MDINEHHHAMTDNNGVHIIWDIDSSQHFIHMLVDSMQGQQHSSKSFMVRKYSMFLPKKNDANAELKSDILHKLLNIS